MLLGTFSFPFNKNNFFSVLECTLSGREEGNRQEYPVYSFKNDENVEPSLTKKHVYWSTLYYDEDNEGVYIYIYIMKLLH